MEAINASCPGARGGTGNKGDQLGNMKSQSSPEYQLMRVECDNQSIQHQQLLPGPPRAQSIKDLGDSLFPFLFF